MAEKFDNKIYERDIYQETVYSAWLKNANERDVLEKVLQQKFNTWCQKKKVTIIEFGCGTGSAAKRVFKMLESKSVQFEYTGIDPYQDQLDRFREQFPDTSKITLLKRDIESFKPSQKYDIALVVHSLYYVDNMKKALKKILKSADKAIIIHQGKEGINTIHKKFPHFTKKGNYIISTYEAITSVLEEMKVKFQYKVYPTQTKIKSCKDPNNLEGQKMIKFFLERYNIPKREIEEVCTFLKIMPDSMIHEMAVIFVN